MTAVTTAAIAAAARWGQSFQRPDDWAWLHSSVRTEARAAAVEWLLGLPASRERMAAFEARFVAEVEREDAERKGQANG